MCPSDMRVYVVHVYIYICFFNIKLGVYVVLYIYTHFAASSPPDGFERVRLSIYGCLCAVCMCVEHARALLDGRVIGRYCIASSVWRLEVIFFSTKLARGTAHTHTYTHPRIHTHTRAEWYFIFTPTADKLVCLDGNEGGKSSTV